VQHNADVVFLARDELAGQRRGAVGMVRSRRRELQMDGAREAAGRDVGEVEEGVGGYGDAGESYRGGEEEGGADVGAAGGLGG